VWKTGDHGLEWIVEGHGCSAAKLQDGALLRKIFSEIITGLALLSESHMACHTFPEYHSLCLNVFSCRPRRRWEFEQRLRELLDAEDVCVRSLKREYASAGILE